MMKAPGSLSFSSAMAAGENGRPQSWHSESRQALQNQQVWVGMGCPSSVASQLGTTTFYCPPCTSGWGSQVGLQPGRGSSAPSASAALA